MLWEKTSWRMSSQKRRTRLENSTRSLSFPGSANHGKEDLNNLILPDKTFRVNMCGEVMKSDTGTKESFRDKPHMKHFGMNSLSVGAWVSRNCSRTSWKTGNVAAESEPDDTEPFSSTTSDSPHLCKHTHKTTQTVRVETLRSIHPHLVHGNIWFEYRQKAEMELRKKGTKYCKWIYDTIPASTAIKEAF